MFDATVDRRGESLSLGLLGEVEYAEGKRDIGLKLMERSAALAGETSFTWWRAGMLGKLVDCALEQGWLDQAEAYAGEALTSSHDLGDRLRIVRGLARLAGIAADRSDPDRAGRLWGAVEAEEARGPVGAWEAQREQYRERVGSVDEHALQEGRVMSLDQAVALALDS